MFGEKKTEIMIVYEKKTKEYAEYLYDLIGSMREGIKATKWDEKTYEANVNNMSSDNYVIFIGDNKITKPMIKNMDVKFDKFGMAYGWLGKRAVMYVHTNIHRKETYDKFLEFAVSYERQFEKVEKLSDKVSNKLGIDIPTSMLGTGGAALAGVGSRNALKAGVFRMIPGLFGAVGVVADVLTIDSALKESKIREQQYTCLVLAMYVDGLKDFLGV